MFDFSLFFGAFQWYFVKIMWSAKFFLCYGYIISNSGIFEKISLQAYLGVRGHERDLGFQEAVRIDWPLKNTLEPVTYLLEKMVS